jgi:hypothetical protein
MPLITIEKFVGGWHSSNVTSDIQQDPTDATDLLNVEYYPRGTISKRGGYVSYDMSSNPLTGVMNIFPWKDNNFSNTNLVYTSTSGANVSGDVYTLTISASTATVSKVFSAVSHPASSWSPKLSADEVHVASYGGSAIAVAGGSDCPLVFATSPGCAVIWSGVPSGSKYVVAWGQYLFVANLLVGATRNRSRIRWNTNGDMANWPSTYYIDLDPDDGDEITGMRALGDYLVVFKRNKIFVIYWQGGALLFKELRRSATVGCVAGRTIVEKDQKLYFLADDGFYSFDGTNTTELSKKIKDKVLDIDFSVPWLHHSEVYESHRQIWFGVRHKMVAGEEALQDYQKSANRVFVYDWELDNWTIYDIQASTFANIMTSAEKYWYDLIENYSSNTNTIGSYTGAESPIFLLGHSNYTNSVKKSCISEFTNSTVDITSTPINAYWTSIWFDLGDPTINKRYTRWTILANQESTIDAVALTAQLYEDFKPTSYTLDDGSTSTHTVYLTGTSSWEDNNPLECRIDTSRTVRAFQVKLSNNIANQKFTVHKMVVDGMAKGRTKV